MLKSIAFSIILTLGLLSGAQAGQNLKVGEEVYVCACGEKCPCDTLSNKPGPCTCAREIKPLVEARVKSVEKDSAVVSIEGLERTLVTKPRFVCSCTSQCGCDTSSQTKGKCACGIPMKEAP